VFGSHFAFETGQSWACFYIQNTVYLSFIVKFSVVSRKILFQKSKVKKNHYNWNINDSD